MADLRLGVDLGDTSVDAVVLDDRDYVLARAKLASGEDEAASIAAAVAAMASAGGGDADPRRITRAVLGSTAALDAVESRRELRRVAVLRVGSPLTLAIPPLVTWPRDLREAVSAGEAVVGGGAEYDGRSVAPLDRDAVMRFLAGVTNAEAVAVTGLFSPAHPAQEHEVADLVRRELGAATVVSLSHEMGTVGLLERENATVLNAALGGVAERLAGGFGEALEHAGVDAEMFFATGDGTVMSLEHALRFPAHMVGSGLASGIRGAAWLSGAVDGVMLDMGATRSSVGMLARGVPRERPAPTELAGVRTNLPIPEVVPLRLGGATVVRVDGGTPAIGEDSVGAGLRERALSFGGSTPTLTDAAVAGGRARLGSHSLSAAQRKALEGVLPVLDRLLADGVERARHGLAAATLVVAFGGASILVPENLAGVSEMIVPADGDIAGAVGLVVAPAGGQSDRICADRPGVRATTIEAVRADAVARAIHAGADPARVQIVDVEEVPLSYLLDPPIRIRVRAVGPPI